MEGSNRRRFLGRLASGVAGGGMTTALRADTAKEEKEIGAGSSRNEAVANASGPFADLGPGGSRPKFGSMHAWRLQAIPGRKVHIEFHNSQYVLRIGERFNADEFADRLVQAQ